jgi:PilZ domain-containing protein
MWREDFGIAHMRTLTQREKRIGLHLPLEVSGQDAEGASFRESTHTVNISGGGVCFEMNRLPFVGARLTLNIQLPPPLRKHFGGQAVYRARAVVCRVERYEGHGACRVGARFLGEVDG